MQTETLNGKKVPETVVPDDNRVTKEIASTSTIPLDYQYDEKQMMANMSLAISSDVEDVKEQELLNDETFGYASKKMYSSMNGQDFAGTDEEATQYGIDLMRKVDNILYNPSKESLYGFVSQVDKMSSEEAQSALYMMDMFEAKEWTMNGVTEAVGYMGQDAATYIGFSTLGYAFAGKEAAKLAAKNAMVASLRKVALSDAGIGAIEGAIYGGAFTAGKELVKEDAGQEFDSANVAINTAMGAGLGAAAGKYLPEMFEYAGNKMQKWVSKDGTIDVTKVKTDADAGDKDAAGILEDIGLFDGYFGRKLDDFEGTRAGQLITGKQQILESGKVKKDIPKNKDDGIGLIERQKRQLEKSIKNPPKGKEVVNPESDKKYVLGDDGNVYFLSRKGWRESKQWGLKERLEDIEKYGYEKVKKREDDLAKEMKKSLTTQGDVGYKDSHSSPKRGDGSASIDALDKVYPNDIYSSKAVRFYGDGDKKQDIEAIKILKEIKGKPNAKVKIYRSIPDDIDAEINPNDWVTITKEYAIQHGEARFNGKYKILEREVKASDIITDGNSIHEQGYDPKNGEN